MLWEGTSNINALDIITRAVGKSRAHRTLEAALTKLLDEASADPGGFPRTACALRSTGRLPSPSASPPNPRWRTSARLAASALYHVTSAILMTWEAARRARTRDGRCTRGWCSNIG